MASMTRSDWWPGVCPGVVRIVTLPSANTSRSPASFSMVCVAANAGLTGWVMAQSYSDPWMRIVEDGKRPMLPTWSPWVWETATYVTSAGLTPISASCAMSVRVRR